MSLTCGSVGMSFGRTDVIRKQRVSKTKSHLAAVWPYWAIYWTLGNFLKPLAIINLPKSPPFLGNFCIFIFLVKSFLGNIYRLWQLFTGHTAGGFNFKCVQELKDCSFAQIYLLVHSGPRWLKEQDRHITVNCCVWYWAKNWCCTRIETFQICLTLDQLISIWVLLCSLNVYFREAMHIITGYRLHCK